MSDTLVYNIVNTKLYAYCKFAINYHIYIISQNDLQTKPIITKLNLEFKSLRLRTIFAYQPTLSPTKSSFSNQRQSF